jgi:membrane associated rhomboid family serine protease
MADQRPLKICVVCREDCSDRPRTKDSKGRYYCKPCYERALKRYREKQAVAARRKGHDPSPEDRAELIGLTDEASTAGQPPAAAEPGAVCPGCDRPLPADSRICVECGINVETGRSIVTSRGLDEDTIYGNAERIMRWVSWLTPIGTFPIASEAMGSRKPYAAWAITALTVIVGIWFWLSTDAQMDGRKDLMLWGGNAPPSAELIMMYYEWTDWGDARAFEARMAQLQSQPDGDGQPLLEELIVQAHDTLTPAQQPIGRFHWYQLLTHALLHGDIFHLAGNLLFLLILGSRVNTLVGSIGTAILYPILAILAALAQMTSVVTEEPSAMLGASGAIMGLAGMYVVLFPVNRMHMAAWFRCLFYFRIKMWALRGFWVVLFYMAFDVLYVSIGAETGVAHWAHLGGFVGGAAIALILLVSRLLNAGGGDLISVVLGRHAWTVVGRPGEKDRLGLRLPGV